ALVADNLVVVATRHGEVHLVDVVEGDRVGKKGFGEAIEGTPVLVDGRLLVVPVAAGKHGPGAYDLVEGQRRRARRGPPPAAGLPGSQRRALRPPPLAAFFASPVALPPGAVAVADDRGQVRAFDPTSGAVRWTADLGAPVHETPALAGDLLLVPTTRGVLAALDAATGAERWRHEAEGEGVLFATPAVVPGGIVVGASDGVLRRLDLATGAVAWTHRFDGNVSAAPLVAGEAVYDGTLGERFAALDLATGAETWSTELPGRVKSAAVAVGGLLVVFAEPHHLHA